MTARQYWLLNGIAGLVVLLVTWNITSFVGNRSLQSQALQRQQFINEGIRLSRLNSELVKSLALASAQSADSEIRDRLAAHGITFVFTPAPDTEP